MSRAFDFTVAGVIYIIAAIIHRMGTELFAPGSVLYDIATDGTGNVNGTTHAATWFDIITIWAPLLCVGGISAWLIVKEYKRQVQTATRQRPG